MPDWRRIVGERLQSLRLTAAAESALREEMAQHLEDTYRDLRSAGCSEDEAYEKALAELSDGVPLRAEAHRGNRMEKHDAVPAGDLQAGSFWRDLGRDLRYAVRTMRKSPLFVLVVVLTLGLGIGANTTVFTLINTLILNPLPVPDASRLAAMGLQDSGGRTRNGLPQPVSYADLKDYGQRNRVFESLAGYSSPRVVTWQQGTGSHTLFAELVTGNYFATLGLRPALGRFFSPEEDGAPGAHPVAVVNYATWQTLFGGTTDILGKTVRLNHVAFTVIGVAPPKFIGLNAIFGPDLWIPGAMAEALLPNEMAGILSNRQKPGFLGVGRYRAGITKEQAEANLATISADLGREFPDADEGRTTVVLPVRDVMFASAASGSRSIVAAGAVLLAVVGIVLLIACSNVANLLLARSAGRRQEMAVRMAMGASRPRLVRQLLTESVLLGLLSGALGVGIGYVGLHLFFGMLPGAANFIEPKLDGLVLAFALLVSLATGFVFGGIPAFQAARANVADALKEESRSTGRSRRRVSLANALLVGQVAFSFVLLATAALFLRSIGRAYEIDPGFQTAHLSVFMTNPGPAGYGKPQTEAFYQDARDRVMRLPGIESVSWASNMPLWGRSVTGLQIEGRQARSRTEKIRTILNTVDRDYFETAGVKIERGRGFTDADRENGLAVAVVNEKLAQDYWPDGDSLGKRIQLPGEMQMRQIVGVARTANYTNWGEPPQLCVYVPLKQNYMDTMILYVKSQGDPLQVIAPVVREVHAAAPLVTVMSPRTGRQIIDGGLFSARAGVVLLTVFGLLALGLASIGLYGIMAYSVNQRKREIGLRMALGAASGSVLRLILQQGMSLVATGVAIGLGASLVVGRLLSRMLYGVSASDPLSIGGAVLLLVLIALSACYLPARRASRVDPLVALREG